MMTTTRLYDTNAPASMSSWSEPRGWFLKKWFYKAFLGNKFIRLLCCVCDDRLLDDMKLESNIRDEIRRELTMHRRGTGRKAVTDAALDIYEETGYDLRHFAHDRALEREAALEEAAEERKQAAARRRTVELEARERVRVEAVRQAVEERRHNEAMQLQREVGNAHIQMISEIVGVSFEQVQEAIRGVTSGPVLAIAPSTEQESRRIAVTQHLERVAAERLLGGDVEESSEGGDDPPEELEEHKECNHGTRVIPRFVAAVCCALRGKFGVMSPSEANRLLIQREYLKLCRETDIRNVDAATHQQWVLNTYFNEGVMEHLATTRARVPAWLARAFGSNQMVGPTVC